MKISTLIFSTPLFLSSLAGNSAFAGDTSLLYQDLSAMAKASIQSEVSALNLAVTTYLDSSTSNNTSTQNHSSYKKGELSIFKKFGKPNGIDAEIFYDACILSNDTISAITATRITRKNLQVTSDIMHIQSLRQSMGPRFFKMAERVCLNAKARFIKRLEVATSKDTPIHLSSEIVSNVANIVFFPAYYAKPNLYRKMLSVLPLMINSFVIVTTASPLVAAAGAAFWIPLSRITGSALSIRSMLPRRDDIIRQTQVTTLEEAKCIRMDLTPEEVILERD
jgi:hypothetical protein